MQFEYIVAELTLTCAKLSVQCLSVIEGSIFCYFFLYFLQMFLTLNKLQAL